MAYFNGITVNKLLVNVMMEKNKNWTELTETTVQKDNENTFIQ